MMQALGYAVGLVMRATPDIIGVGGAASVAYGAWLIYAPAGFIVGGCIIVAGSLLRARGEQ